MPQQAAASDLASEELERTVHDLRVVLGKLNRQLRQTSTTRVRDLTWAQGLVLSRLDRFGPAGTTDLARAEGMRPQSMGEMVNALASCGYVGSSKDPNDGRRTVHAITPAGFERLSVERAARQDSLLYAAATKLTLEEQAQLLPACVAMLERLLGT